MRKFIVRRAIGSILALLAAALLIFSASRLLSDPKYLLLPEQGRKGIDEEVWNRMADELHLNDPVPVQFAYWLWDVAHGDLGTDLQDGLPLWPKLKKKFVPSIKLGIVSWVLATIVGIPLGVLSAVKRGTGWDYIGRTFALLGQATPAFVVGILLILLFTVWLGWLPAGTQGEGLAIRNYIMPTITLSWLPAASYLRLTRSAMLEVLDSEFIKLARAKGVGPSTVVWKHAFKNAALVPLTATVLVFAGFITGAVVVEAVFAWPGVGSFAVQSVFTNNINILVVITVMFTALFIAANFVADVLYAFIDPRIRYS